MDSLSPAGVMQYPATTTMRTRRRLAWFERMRRRWSGELHEAIAEAHGWTVRTEDGMHIYRDPRFDVHRAAR